ncbi:hypothetical protein QTI66_20105 [Variovorax sp. J22R133]|uniref:hypothetical protein n=1 Tax=Variovorax brevis TaxID=3053503 RepID=UPI002577B337|nr:hypothetical protein [Variovorax sp. J22R133]MDM0114467.1 hypothetical protein [Variovorax sp. J22R133]
MELTIAVFALGVALWQLRLQRAAMQQESRLNALLHLASMLRDQIDFYEKIIDDQKRRNGDWLSLAARVNKELRPLLNNMNQELIKSVSQNAQGLDVNAIDQALKRRPESDVPPDSGRGRLA